jgi:predicted ATPase/class 3 adenylate cyclase
MTELPTGTVTLLFTDIEGSTRLLQDVGRTRYSGLLERHRALLREQLVRGGGVEVEMQGDSFHFAFASAIEAVGAAAAAQRALALEPWPEDGAVRVRMGLHTGDVDVVSRLYVGLDVHRAARVMDAAHGSQVLISAATRELVQRELQEGVALRDLGEHALKDLIEPERLYQLELNGLVADFPPPRSTARPRDRLPRPATPLIGREREREEVAALVQRDDVRLATLVGPGGTGKTRLAVQVGLDIAHGYPDGAWFVDLSALRDAVAVPAAIGQEIAGSAVDVAEYLRTRRALLILDNLEQIVAAAPFVADLLRRASRLTVIATSRIPLRLSGEHVYVVPPLGERDAIALFESRAIAAGCDVVDESAAREISRRLDCLPLAVELAAARTRLLSPAALLDRLDERLEVLRGGPRDAPTRQQTLRATLEWSYALLRPDAQTLFARLAVFSGRCSLDAAQEVCDAGLDELEELVDNSLLRMRDESVTMLETVREYALEVLAQSGEEHHWRERHARYILRLAQDEDAKFDGPDQVLALEALARDHDNIREALRWSLGPGIELELALELAVAASWFWFLRGHLQEGRGWLAAVVERAPQGRSAAMATAYMRSGSLAETQGDYAAAEGWYASVAAHRGRK